MQEEMTVVDWFDPKNIEHVKAYHHLDTTGFWPEGFLPKEIEIPSAWQFSILGKMAECWVDEMLLGYEQILSHRPGIVKTGLEPNEDQG